ncbi:MAG: hypothetical protein HY054_11270, partial [Proteobacteria bacterium]|nr:hypothetical protein [Pseudomonadota bacterium]
MSFEREAVEVELALRDSAEEQGVEASVLQIEPPVDRVLAERVGRVVEAWKRVEGALRQRVEEKTGEAPKRSSDALRLAVQHELLTADQIQSLNGLRIMRNLAVHGPPTEFSEKHATQFVVLADALVTLLNFRKLGNQAEHEG